MNEMTTETTRTTSLKPRASADAFLLKKAPCRGEGASVKKPLADKKPVAPLPRESALIADLECSTRCKNILHSHGYFYLHEISHLKMDDLIKFQGAGLKSAKEIRKLIAANGISHSLKKALSEILSAAPCPLQEDELLAQLKKLTGVAIGKEDLRKLVENMNDINKDIYYSVKFANHSFIFGAK